MSEKKYFDLGNTTSPILALSSSTSLYTANPQLNISWKVGSLDENNEAILTMLASEDILRREWDTPEEDEQWADL